MSSNVSARRRQRAIRYETRARNYRSQADLLLRRDSDTDCAGALLYEAAKQCINAVANQRGSNPGSTGAKLNVLSAIAGKEPAGANLSQNWEGAAKLHIHADRGHLSAGEYGESWQQAQAFIESMLNIYARNA